MNKRSVIVFSAFLLILLLVVLIIHSFEDFKSSRLLSLFYLLFLSILSLIVHSRTRKAIERNQQSEATKVLLSMISIKLLGSLALLAVYYYYSPEKTRNFILPFFVIYFSFTLYEIFSLKKVERETKRIIDAGN